MSIAEDRHRWPDRSYRAWDDGIDPRRDPHWYADDPADEDLDDPLT